MAVATSQERFELPLSDEQVREGLSVLGHNTFGQITYVQCNLDNLQVSSAVPLSKFVFLQRLSLNHNRLLSLQALRGLSCLVYLSAHHNSLTDSVFDDLRGSALTLEKLDLSNNNLTSLEGLQHLPYLIDIAADNNRIEQLHAKEFKPLKSLLRLSLRNNCLTVIETNTFAGSPYLRMLNLSYNQLPNCRFATCLLLNLDTLLLRHNRLSEVGEDLAGCKALVTLDVSSNRVSQVEDLEPLRVVTALRRLRVEHNPFLDAYTDTDLDGDEIGNQFLRGDDDSAPGGADADATGTGDTASPLVSLAVAPDAPEDDEYGTAAQERPLSRSEIVMPDDGTSATGKRIGSNATAVTGTAAARTAAIADSTRTSRLQLEGLAPPNTRTSVSTMINAKRSLDLPWGTDRMQELEALSKARQIFLRLLFMFPQLTQLNNVQVNAEDVAKAMYFFEPQAAGQRSNNSPS